MESQGPVGELDHVAVVVANLDRALALFEEAFGLPIETRATLEEADMKIVFLRAGPARVELIEPLGETARRERLDGAEMRIEHLAFAVADLETAAARGRGAGFELAGGVAPRAPEEPFFAAGAKSLFSRPASSGGIVFQFTEKLEKEQR